MLFADSKKIIKLNRRFFKKNKETNVIAFPLHTRTCDGRYFIGDVVICPKVAEEEAQLAKTRTEDRIIELLIHGILHLDGYSDKNRKEWSVMKKKQERLFNEIIREKL